MVDCLIDTDQKIADWLIKITSMFLGKAEIAIREGNKSRFAIMGFNTSAAFWVYDFLFNTINNNFHVD